MGTRNSSWTPRDWFNPPAGFGTEDARTAADSAESVAEVAALAAVAAQHQAARVVAEHRRNGTTVRELARRLNANEGYLGGQLAGRYPAALADIAAWALALDDPAILTAAADGARDVVAAHLGARRGPT